MMTHPNRGIQQYSNPHRRRSRIRELVRRHWGKIALAGVAVAALGGKPAYQYYRARTIPRGIVVTTYHGELSDGRRTVQELRKLLRERKIAVVALEGSFATAEDSRTLQHNIVEAQKIIRDRRAKNYSTEEISQELERFFSLAGVSEGMVSVYAEATARGIPIRLLENMEIGQARGLQSYLQKVNEGFSLIKKQPTLLASQKVMEKMIEHEDKLRAGRDSEMKEELEKIREKFRGKGEVFAVVGEQHFSVAQGNRVEQIDLAAELRNKYPRLNSVEERTMSPQLRLMRNTILYHINSYMYNASVTKQEIGRRAVEKARNLTPTQYAELDRKYGNLPYAERAEKIAKELAK